MSKPSSSTTWTRSRRPDPFAVCNAGVYELLPDDAQGLRDKIAFLVQADVLYRQGFSSEELYVFKHSLIQEAAYQSLLKSARQHHHQRVAKAMESLYEADVEPHLLDLARHLISAGPSADLEPVVRYGRRAGDRALTMFAWREAVYYHSAALSAGEKAGCLDPGQRADLHYLAALRLIGMAMCGAAWSTTTERFNSIDSPTTSAVSPRCSSRRSL
jgi:hypothetical protein